MKIKLTEPIFQRAFPSYLFFTAFLLLGIAAPTVCGQETRGTILGVVRDESGSVVSGAVIEARNTGTNISVRGIANDSGVFEMPYLSPGEYEVTTTAQGFKTSRQRGIPVTVGGRINLNIQLEIGQVSEAVEVSGAAPILETSSANGSTTLSELQIRSLPVFGNNAVLQARSVPGLQWTGQPNYLGLHSNVGASSISAAGGVGGNEFTLDGVPNAAGGRRVGFMPNTDSVEELKVDVANFDARTGHTSGATVSMVTKSGTSDYHGVLSYMHWQQRWNGTQSTTNAGYWGQVEQARAAQNQALLNTLLSQERQPSGHANHYSGAIGGPVWFPKKYFGPLGWERGRERLFFFFSYSGLRENKSEEANAVNRTVPTLKMRQGDFSEFLSLGSQYQIYDPRTARCSDGLPAPCSRSGVTVVRNPFPNNQVPILNPIYKYYANIYPVPNNVPGVVARDFQNNYLASATPFNWKYKAYQNRVDYNVTERQKMTGKWSWNDFLEDRGDWTYETQRGLHSGGLVRRNLGITLDYIITLNSTTNLIVSAGFNRFIEGNKLNAVQAAGSPTLAGFPGYLDQKAAPYIRLPVITINSYETISGGYPGYTRFSTAFHRGELSKVIGPHTIVSGYDLRRQYRAAYGPGNSSGIFNFDNNYMRRRSDNPDNAAQRALSWAAFALGVPSSASIDTNDSLYLTNPYRAGYVQDNWRATSKLTLNLGFRLEYEGGFRERFNRGLPGFDPNATLPITTAAEAAYASIAARVGLPADQFKVRGGSLYLGQNGAPETTHAGNWSYLPRAGFAYSLTDKTVLRGGYGIYADTINVLNFGVDQFGYNRATGTPITNDNGVSFNFADLSNGVTLLSNPFPVRADGTRFNVPLGNQLGLMARVGRGQTFINPNWKNARQHRWRFGLQREISRNLAVDIGYLGSYTNNVSVVNNNPGDGDLSLPLSYLPEQYWASGMIRRPDINAALSESLPNPFNIANFASLATANPTLYQDMSTNGFFTQATISRAALLRAYPQMNGVNIIRQSIGALKYHHLEASVTRRLSGGLTFIASYTWASSQVKDFIQNEFDSEPVYRQNPNSRPHHFMVNTVWEMPFGKGRRFLPYGGPIGALAGGWKLSGTYHLQSGRNFDFGNLFFYGDNLRAIKLDGDDQSTDRWFNWQLFPGAARDFIASNRAAYETRIRGIVPASVLQQMGNICGSGNNAPCTYENVAPANFQPAGFHRRVFPSRLNWLRGDKMSQLDLSLARTLKIKEQVGFEFRLDMINALNTVQWDNPNTDVNSSNFGRVTTQWNTPRFIQFQLRFMF
jgi:hypothetical protein